MVPDSLSHVMRDYFRRAGIKKQGGAHMFRHTMATMMLDNGADIRYIQEILGHALLETTQRYTHVSIQKLKEIHAATHPGAKSGRGTQREDAEALLALLDDDTWSAEPESQTNDEIRGKESQQDAAFHGRLLSGK